MSQQVAGAAMLLGDAQRYAAQSGGRVSVRAAERLGERGHLEPTAVVLRQGQPMAWLFGMTSWHEIQPLVEIALGPTAAVRAA